MLDPKHDLDFFVPQATARDVRGALEGDPQRFRRTSIAVYGETCEQVDQMLAVNRAQIEYVKIGSHYALRRTDALEVAEVCRRHGIKPYFGGGLIENAVGNGSSVAAIAKRLQQLGFDTIEISDGFDEVGNTKIDALVRDLSKDFDVLLEVGEKTQENIDVTSLDEEFARALDTDAKGVILEGGGNGNVCIHDKDRNPKPLLIARMMMRAGEEIDRVMIEAPFPPQQQHVLHAHGWDARITNAHCDPESFTGLIDDRLDMMTADGRASVQRARKRLFEIIEEVEKHCGGRSPSLDAAVNAAYVEYDCSDADDLEHIREEAMRLASPDTAT